jgi:hypothetical protein
MDMGGHFEWERILDVGGDPGWEGTPWEQTEAARREPFYKWSWLARKPERQLHKNILEGAHVDIGGVRV